MESLGFWLTNGQMPWRGQAHRQSSSRHSRRWCLRAVYFSPDCWTLMRNLQLKRAAVPPIEIPAPPRKSLQEWWGGLPACPICLKNRRPLAGKIPAPLRFAGVRFTNSFVPSPGCAIIPPMPVQNRIVKVQKRNRALVRFDPARIWQGDSPRGGIHRRLSAGFPAGRERQNLRVARIG